MHDDEFTKGMRGQFRGDFTRDTFDPSRHFSRVLMQQGRVQLDADWNEQHSIILHYLRALGADIIGPHGAPASDDGEPGTGFATIVADDGRALNIAAGYYYVNGIRCENGNDVSFSAQADWPLEENPFAEAGNYLIYLDVWERHLSHVEDDYIREKALGGPDSASRAQVIWQMKALLLNNDETTEEILDYKNTYATFLAKLGPVIQPGSALMRARARRALPPQEPCLISPESSYRGPENQLYRVEIHLPGSVTGTQKPTFKWSRENASVIFPVREMAGDTVTLEHLGRDPRCGLQPNDWVELLDEDIIKHNQPNTLFKVEAVDPETNQVILQSVPGFTVDTTHGHAYLRRWDQKKGGGNGIDVVESASGNDWIMLEDGVEVQFPAASADENQEVVAHRYQTGDYWLIPARTVTGDVEWPGTVDSPTALAAQGVQHHYAPIAQINVADSGNFSLVNDLRRKLNRLWQ